MSLYQQFLSLIECCHTAQVDSVNDNNVTILLAQDNNLTTMAEISTHELKVGDTEDVNTTTPIIITPQTSSWFKTFDVPVQLPYIIINRDIPPMLFFDIEFVPTKRSGGIGTHHILHFAAVGINSQREPQVYLSILMDYQRCEDIVKNLDHRTFSFAKRNLYNTNMYEDWNLDGHLTLDRIRDVFNVYCQHVNTWVGFGTENDTRAFMECVDPVLWKKIKVIDLQKELLKTLFGYKTNGVGIQNLTTALEAVCPDFDFNPYHSHHAVYDAFAIMAIFEAGRLKFIEVIKNIEQDCIDRHLMTKQEQATCCDWNTDEPKRE